jgi:hypothetical protein
MAKNAVTHVAPIATIKAPGSNSSPVELLQDTTRLATQAKRESPHITFLT